jgi:5-oxoprolinase (ATP-hydrolysing) subunit A
VVLLNLDAGERDDEPVELWAAVDVLCAACGGHAGDPASMARVVAFCATRVRPGLGAHPSYPDPAGFGRRRLHIEPDALRETLVQQCSTLAQIARGQGVVVGWLKPHGALYHDAAADLALARLVVDVARVTLGEGVVVIGPARGHLASAARDAGIAYLREAFADRRARPDGTLVPRDQADPLITDPAQCAAHARMAASEVDTICIHADTPNALAIAAAVRAALAAP